MNDFLQRRRAAKNSLRQLQDEKYREQSNRKLAASIEQRFKTVFIGALHSIEKHFAVLWGEDEINEEDMTAEQKKWYDLFLDMRDEILDRGNNEKNRCLEELDNYNVSLIKKEYILRAKDDRGKN